MSSLSYCLLDEAYDTNIISNNVLGEPMNKNIGCSANTPVNYEPSMQNQTNLQRLEYTGATPPTPAPSSISTPSPYNNFSANPYEIEMRQTPSPVPTPAPTPPRPSNLQATLDIILQRLEDLELQLNTIKNKNNELNMHDIILFIIVGVLILFVLDSIFKIGKLSV